MADNSADLGYGAGYVVRDSANGTIIDNNTVTRNSTAAAGASGGMGYNNLGTSGFGFADIEDNILWMNTASSFACVGGCAAAAFVDNDYDALDGAANIGSFNRDISADPQFRDPASGDFRLSGDSPCLAFATFRIAGYDLDGHFSDDSLQQTVADLGAYVETIFTDGFDGPPQPPQ
jgi:hypothetical protein